MRKEVREVWIAEDDSEHGNEADALRADRVHEAGRILDELDLDWRDCGPSSVALELVNVGYTIVPYAPA